MSATRIPNPEMLTTEVRDPAFRAFLTRAFGRAAQRQVQEEIRQEQKRASQAAALRNSAGPVRRGPASLADILGPRR